MRAHRETSETETDRSQIVKLGRKKLNKVNLIPTKHLIVVYHGKSHNVCSWSTQS